MQHVVKRDIQNSNLLNINVKGAFIFFLENIHVYKMFGRIFNRKCASRKAFAQKAYTGKSGANPINIDIRMIVIIHIHPAQLFIAC